MQQVLIGGAKGNTSLVTRYNALQGGAAWWVGEDWAEQVMPTAGTLSKLRIQAEVAPGVGKSFTITVRKNGADTGLAATITGAGVQEASDLVDEIAFVAGDRVAVKVTQVGDPTDCKLRWSTYWVGDVPGESIVLGSSYDTPAGGGTGYSQIGTSYGNMAGAAEDFGHKQLMPTAGTFKKLYIHLTTAPGAGEDRVFTVRRNGGDTSIVATLEDAEDTGNDIVNTQAYVATDYVGLKCVASAGAAGSRVHWGIVFQADVDGESLILGGSSDNLHISSTEFTYLSSEAAAAWSTTERMQLGQDICNLSKLHCEISAAPGVGSSWAFMLRREAGDTAVVASIANPDTEGNSGANSIDVATFDLLSIESDPANSPDVADLIWSLVAFEEPVSEEAPPQGGGMAAKLLAAVLI